MGMPGLAVHRTCAKKEIGPVHSLNKPGQNDKRTKGHSQTGPAFQDLTLGWKQPETDNNDNLHLLPLSHL